MKCPKCQFDNPEGINSCGKCGAKLEMICPRCNSSNPPEFRHLILVALLVGLCIAGTGCIMGPGGGPMAWLSFSACIQPLSEKHGTWSTDEVNAVRNAIATAGKSHGLKEKKGKFYIAQYALPGKNFELKAYYIANPPIPGDRSHPCGTGLNTKDQTGTIGIELLYLSVRPITYPERGEAESVWKEMYELLQEKFSERVTERSNVKLEP